MSRAGEFTLFIIILQASIGFIDATGMFTNHYLPQMQNNASFTITDLGEYAHAGDHPPDLISELDLFVHWAWDAFLIGLKVLGTIAFVYPTLRDAFHIPEILSTFIQVGVYYIYATWYSQYKSGKPWKYYE